MNYKSLEELLKNTRTESTFCFTHVSLIQPRGRFMIDSGNQEEFWDKYCDRVRKGHEFGVAESPSEYLPVLADIDIKIRDDGDFPADRLYTEQQLYDIIEIYQTTLRSILDECSDEDLTCVVLEKDMYSTKKNEITYLKHGFHLHFPYCFLAKEQQEIHLVPRVQQKIQELNIFSNLGIENSGSVIDKAVCNNHWLLYRSKKSKDSQSYKVTRVFNSELSEIKSLEYAFQHYEIYDAREQLIKIRGKVEYYLPRILSINPWCRSNYIRTLKRGLVSPIKEKLKKERDASLNYRKLSVEEALKEAKELLPMLSIARSEDRTDWLTVGWILYNISEGDPDGLDIWCEFSARCEEKYDESQCIYQWERMVKKDLSLGTLKYFAKMDSPKEYHTYKQEKAQKHITESLEGSHNDIAKALYELYGDEFCCASISTKIWFQFRNHKWERIEEGVFLREKISGSFVGKYQKARKDLYNEASEIVEDDDSAKAKRKMIEVKIKKIDKMIANLKNCTFKNNVMKEAQEVFYDREFKDKLDTNRYLIAFRNGVYDLQSNVFRVGHPEDHLSKALPINYRVFNEDDEVVQNIHTFLEQVFPNSAIRRYFLDISSDIFVGGNHEKTCVFWTGDGDNGKSVTQNLFEMILGDLAIKFDTSVISGKKPNAGSANADLARAGCGVRWAVIDEPNNDESINPGPLKKYTGNDSIYARDLFEKGKDTREIKPMFKLVVICNKLPPIRNADKAAYNRVRVLPFESTFCRTDYPESYEEQLLQKRFPMDRQFSKKLPKMVEPFAWLLLEHRKTQRTRIEPREVLQATDHYKKRNDVFRQFQEECIEEDPEGSISLTNLYASFKGWFRESMPGSSLPTKIDVEEHYVRIWGPTMRGKIWKGYRERYELEPEEGKEEEKKSEEEDDVEVIIEEEEEIEDEDDEEEK